jgi:protein tyrosine phosphatase (PTP) superfamily phosphohydrolase (DUF442 family)
MIINKFKFSAGSKNRVYVRIGLLVMLIVILSETTAHLKSVHIDYRFEAIEFGRFYKSGAMPIRKLKHFVHEYGIRTVIDLRNPGTGDELCPEEFEEIDSQRRGLAEIGVTHAHIPSKQVPEPETLVRFFKVLDDPASYPILVHCHHGTGRAELFTALYRIEYQGWSPEDAREATRWLVWGSSFDPKASKGRFLQDYQPRKQTLAKSGSPT